ncbi:MAG: 6,7-dimethyl-8-ribityllumazine synthase [Chloroflexi bacterium]|nr:6,7-dimethyl-8-ribityllumazine synthase [Chloroflexota bacterium]
MKTPAGRSTVRPKASVALVVARWNREITDVLAAGAERTAKEAGMSVERFGVAGSFELPAAVALLADTGRFDAVVPIGCLIRGETPHFDVLARSVTDGLMQLSLTYPCAIPFGVLTCDTYEQARQRAGGTEGNKGEETMEAAFDLLALRQMVAKAAPAARRSAAARSGVTSAKRRRSPGKA